MKRYSIRNVSLDFFYQFPAVDKQDAIKQGERHAKEHGVTEYKISYIGKWWGEDDPATYKLS